MNKIYRNIQKLMQERCSVSLAAVTLTFCTFFFIIKIYEQMGAYWPSPLKLKGLKDKFLFSLEKDYIPKKKTKMIFKK